MERLLSGVNSILDYVVTSIAGMVMLLLFSFNLPVIAGYYLLQMAGIKLDVMKSLSKKQLALLLIICSFYSVCVYIGLYRIKNLI